MKLYQLRAKLGVTEVAFEAIFTTMEAAMNRIENLRRFDLKSANVWILTRRGDEFVCDILSDAETIKVV